MSPSEPLILQAALKAIRVDHEGESTVTFTIPMSELPAVVMLGQWVQQALRLEVHQQA